MERCKKPYIEYILNSIQCDVSDHVTRGPQSYIGARKTRLKPWCCGHTVCHCCVRVVHISHTWMHTWLHAIAIGPWISVMVSPTQYPSILLGYYLGVLNCRYKILFAMHFLTRINTITLICFVKWIIELGRLSAKST